MNVQTAVTMDDTTGAMTPAVSGDDTWPMVMLSRIGKPPLRFRGFRIFAHRAPRDDAIRLDLWQKKVGGFVVTHTVLWRGQLVPSSSAHGTLDDAICHVETCFDTFDENLPRNEAAGTVDIIGLVDAAYQHHRLRREFGVLAGEALAAWDAWQAQLQKENL